MQYTCPLCKLMPSSHSLKKLFEKKGIIYYYTCPADAILYYDVKGIVEHYNGVLSAMTEKKEWVWIFDSLGFTLTHAMETKVAIALAELISNKFSKNLKKIIIINPTVFIVLTHKLIMPFLNSKVRDLIEITYDSHNAEELFL